MLRSIAVGMWSGLNEITKEGKGREGGRKEESSKRNVKKSWKQEEREGREREKGKRRRIFLGFLLGTRMGRGREGKGK